MKSNSLYRLGGICSILLGISYLVVGVTEVLTPAFMDGAPSLVRPIMHWDEYKGIILTNWWGLLLGAVLALAVVPAVSRSVVHLDEGWVRWAGTLATIGFAATILDNYAAIVTTDAIYNAYSTGTASMRMALTAPGLGQAVDPRGWLAFGGAGIWLLTCSVLALRGRAWPRGLAILGIVGSGVYFMALASNAIPNMVVAGAINTVAGVAALLGPVFYIWLGLFLRSSDQPQAVALRPVEQL